MGVGEGLDRDFGISRCKLKDRNNKAIQYSTGNCIQYPEENHNGGEENICVCVWLNHLQ